jgi:hypothetical protein
MNNMENKELITNEAIARFNCNHLQEIKALCELLEFSLLHALNNGKYKDAVEDVAVWEMADDFTRYAIGMMEAFSVEPRFTANEMLILEGIIHDKAYGYLQNQGAVLD